jgi:hypothetical protein
MVYNEFRFLGGAAQQFEIDNKQQCCAAQQFEVDVGEQLLFGPSLGPSLVGCGLDLVIINAVLLGVALIDVSLYLVGSALL